MPQPRDKNAKHGAEPVRSKESIDEIEARPDAEERFRKAVHAAAKSGPMHRAAKR